MLTLLGSVGEISGVGKTAVHKLSLLGIMTVRDLLFFVPFRFDDFSYVSVIRDVVPSQTVTLRGKIHLIAQRRAHKSRMIITEAIVSDISGSVKVVWFNQPFLKKTLSIGDSVQLSGKTADHAYEVTLMNPIYEKIRQESEMVHTGRLVPVYSVISGITPRQLRTWISICLEETAEHIHDWLPESIRRAEGLLPLSTAIQNIHFPKNSEMAECARKRLVFDEVLLMHIEHRILRERHERLNAPSISFHEKETKALIDSLPFRLTKDQRQAAWQIIRDLGKRSPMNRLLNGDVGCGKTIVAALAIFNTVASGLQVAYMAPTEVLARQVYEKFCELFASQQMSIGLLTSSQREYSVQEAKKSISSKLEARSCHLTVGTHALLEEKVQFQNLGLVVVDEQHRFGVRQRAALLEKNKGTFFPHLLSMTATPIPRSLALSLYGDLDISIIKQMPRGRRSIITKVVPANYREWTYDFIRRQVRAGRQAFVICPLIDPSDVLGARAASEEYERLSKDIFPDMKVGVLHGKIKSKVKAGILSDMAAKKIDILVATSVVEVGIDIPDASVMLIEGAERFGLASLHQLRGRIGRSSHQSYCFLAPSNPDQENLLRLQALVSSSDGFALAEKDLELRGHGDLFGVRQSGLSSFRLATLADVASLKNTEHWAKVIHADAKQYSTIKKHIEHSRQEVHLE